jgi:hypothetical protein
MNKLKKHNEDFLSRYINPEKIEKAPGGFTERIMTLIHTEKILSVDKYPTTKNYKVPLISGLITVSLIISAILVPATDKDSVIFSVFKSLNDIQLAFPEINFEKITRFTLPGWMVYIALAIFMLSLFDRTLNIFFHRKRK